MRARSWIALGGVALACGGTAFNSTTDGGGGTAGSSQAAGAASGGSGTLGHAGRGVGGSVVGSGGKIGTAGNVGIAGVAGGITTGGDVSLGGDVTVGGSLTSGGDSASAGAGPDPIDKTCPGDLPTQGHGCTDGLICTYGDDIRASCHARAQCDNGTWSVDLPQCVALDACAPIVVGSQCDDQTAKPCTIQSSIYCVCTGCTGVGPCTTNTVWACASGSGGQGCPALIPNEGQACTGSAACTYGSCSTGEKMTATCNGTSWGWKPGICGQ
jgi:hypothetical protein